MQASDEVFLLIKTLTKAEKRHFKLQTSLQKGKKEKDYLILFDAIDSIIGNGNLYDENKLKKKIKGKISTNQLHVKKNYLHKQILKSLRSLNEDTNTETKLEILFSEAKILGQKGLYDQLTKKLKLAKNLALKFEKFNTLIDLLSYETILCVRQRPKEAQQELREIYKEIDKFLNLLKKEIAYKALQNEVTTFYRNQVRVRNEKSRQKLEKLKSNPLLAPNLRPATFLSKVSYHYSKALLAKLNSDFPQTLKHYKNLQNVWIGYAHFKEEYPSIYIIYSSNYLVGCHLVRDYSPFPRLLEDLKKVKIKNFDEEAEAFQNIMYLEQLYFLNKEMFEEFGDIKEKAGAIAKDIEWGLDEYGLRIVKSRELTFFHNTAIMFFALEMYEETKYWIMKTQHSADLGQRKDIQLLARLLQLIISSEKEEYLHIDNAFKSFDYHLKKQDKYHDFEGLVTSCLKQLVSRKKSKKEIFSNFKTDLKQYESNKIPGYEEISIWVESKIRNTSFVQIMRERFKSPD